MLTNAGTLSPGGASVIQTTSLIGNFTQTPTGRMLIDPAAGKAGLPQYVQADLAGLLAVEQDEPRDPVLDRS